MKNQSTILLVVAVGCGLVAMLGVRQAINKKDSNQEEMVDVLSASVDIPAGVPLNETNVRFVPMAVSSVPEGAVTSMEEITERGLKVPAMNGDWILKSKLGEKGQFGAIIRIPPGMAAATIPVDATTAHSGMLKAGNRIDLLLTYAERIRRQSRFLSLWKSLQWITESTARTRKVKVRQKTSLCS